MASFYQATVMKELISRKLLLHRKELVGVGVGFADPKNPRKGAAVLIYMHKAKAAATKAIRRTIENLMKTKQWKVPIRSIQTGPAVANANTSQNPRGRYRPIPGGVSIGTTGLTGTAGLTVVNSPNPRQLYILSNNHVLNRTNSTAFSPTYQPGPADAPIQNNQIGRLDRFIRIRPEGQGENLVDAATAIPFSNSLLSPRYLGVGVVPGHQLSYRVGDRFKKMGRTTGFVTGVVESINTDVRVSYGNYGFSALFRRQTIIRSDRGTAISQPGDSGSVWLNASTNYATAVNYASLTGNGGTRAVCYPIHWFMQAFNTRVAIPASSARGLVKKVNYKRNFAYVRPLSKEDLRRIKVVKVKGKRVP
ncbi:hypothetical protein [Ammoniphilus sp. CFH 90114]|uniref:hypothetical protein n=1 Tax=Ammoniphilus sp. CFH 90114 TaxID=2493665 RepID=UPI00100E5160|nr:hypothetical protein [Ammoniphilus sp. CFH 90114]RXT05181.1 hypothetical protein EIZ39_17480 [Ammoniphilus sp. CFH 90114]